MSHGQVIIVSGPSGAGKTTVVKRLLDDGRLPLVLSVSATTRPARPGEKHGVDYFFLSAEDFDRRKAAGEFLECFEVFGSGYWYGTLAAAVSSSLNDGKWVLLEIDVQGMQSVVKRFPDAISIFIRPPSLEELERRLRGRGTETEQTIRRRMEVARHEWLFKDEYTYDVVNESLDDTVETICNAIASHT